MFLFSQEAQEQSTLRLGHRSLDYHKSFPTYSSICIPRALPIGQETLETYSSEERRGEVSILGIAVIINIEIVIYRMETSQSEILLFTNCTDGKEKGQERLSMYMQAKQTIFCMLSILNAKLRINSLGLVISTVRQQRSAQYNRS